MGRCIAHLELSLGGLAGSISWWSSEDHAASGDTSCETKDGFSGIVDVWQGLAISSREYLRSKVNDEVAVWGLLYLSPRDLTEPWFAPPRYQPS